MNLKYYLVFTSIVILLTSCNSESIVPSDAISALTPTHVPVMATTPAATPTLTPTVPAPTTVYISSDGSGDYATLAMAIESVAAESTIILDEGTFYLEGPLEIDKPLTLEGAGSDKTIVTGEGPRVVVRYTGEGLLTIHDMTFRREGDFAAAVMVVLSGEVDFSNCRFTGGAPNEDKSISGAGLIFFNDSAGVVKNCEIDENVEQGILVLGQAKPELIDNKIHDNGGVGIYFQIEEDGGVAEMNNLQRNGLADFGSGTDIRVFGSFAPTLASNSCSRGGYGLGSSNSELGDHSGIVLVSRGDLPAASRVGANDCAIAWCSTPTGSLLNMTCQSRR